MKISPGQMLKKTMAYLSNIEAAKKKAVFVGLPVGKAGSKVYKSGASIIEVGAGHEYGIPGKLPRRSFLRAPFAIKNKALAATIAKQFRAVFDGRHADKALGLIGVAASDVSQGAFTTRGYGTVSYTHLTLPTKA